MSELRTIDFGNSLFGQSILGLRDSDPSKKNGTENVSLQGEDTMKGASASASASASANASAIGSGNGNEDANVDFPQIVRNDLETEAKYVKLFNGEIVNLRKTSLKKNVLELDSEFSLLDMESLRSKAELRVRIKENNKKLGNGYLRPTPGPTPDKNKISNLNPNHDSSKIWTEKYCPRSFLQLCSAGNDKQYRVIMKWLSSWSSYANNESRNRGRDDMDSMKRPHRKILLIHGPPGVGKTISAHILARQMGFNVQELNAANSMDTLPQASSSSLSTVGNAHANAATALKLKILNSLTSNSVSDSTKPSCLLIDELDSLANVNEVTRVLADLVHSDERATWSKRSYNNDASGRNGDKKSRKRKDKILNRPIICIANDIYARQSGRVGPNPLEKIRAISEVVAFKRPSLAQKATGVKVSGNAMKSVKDFLMSVNEKENLGLDYREIGDICESCEGDFRACLNQMQFNGRRLDLDELSRSKRNINNGYSNSNSNSNSNSHSHSHSHGHNHSHSKTTSTATLQDKSISWFAMVDDIFKRDPQLKKEENFNKLLIKYMDGPGKAVTSSSDSFEKIINGVFNQYLDIVHLQDNSLRRPTQLSDWLHYYDKFNQTNMDTSQYFPLVALKSWSLFSDIKSQKNAVDNNPLVPNMRNLAFESYETLKENKQATRSAMQNIPIPLKLAVGAHDLETLATLFLPFLSKILTPNLSSKVKTQLSSYELAVVDKVARLAIGIDIKLEFERHIESGQSNLKFSPDWDTLSQFKNDIFRTTQIWDTKICQAKRHNLFPLMTERIAEIKSARVKRSRKVLEEEAEFEGTLKKSRKNSDQMQQHQLNDSSAQTKNNYFFKERYDSVKAGLLDTGLENKHPVETLSNTRIWVNYNEGFSNAVRKEITWSDFWHP